MLSQNHSWNGLTRPARINDNLPPAAAGSPELRCRVDSQPGTLAALRTRPGHERRPRGGQVGLPRPWDRTGPDRTGPERAWDGLGALGRRPWVGKGGDWGRGRPLGRRAAASSLRALRVFALHRGDPGPGWLLRLALVRLGWRRMRGVSEPPWGWSRACWGPRAYAGARGETQERTGDSGCSNSALVPRTRRPRGRFWGDGEGTAECERHSGR